jgi:hypothetical protein
LWRDVAGGNLRPQPVFWIPLKPESARVDLLRAILEVQTSCNFGRPLHILTAAMRIGLVRMDPWVLPTLELNVYLNQRKATEDRMEASRFFVELGAFLSFGDVRDRLRLYYTFRDRQRFDYGIFAAALAANYCDSC